MDNQLDPQALALAKAIRRTETGGHKDPYNARGASGEFGAFQFMPATYKSLAQKHLGNPNAAPTVENQNKIVYSEIKKLKDQGYNPAQIASIWNSGKPDRYKNGGVGVNKYGVAYNVPQYVSKVSQNYKALIGTVQPVQQKPVEPVEPTIEQQKQERIAQGLPVSVREDRAEPTMVGGIIREIVKQPLKAALSVARPIVGYSKGVSVDTNYLGNVGDYGTEIQKDTTNLANKYKAGEISLGRAAIGGAGAGAKQAMDFAAVVPVGKVAASAKAGIVSKTAIPTLKTAAKESLIRGGAVGAGYDVSSQLASGEKYNPAQTLVAGAVGTVLDFGLTKAIPEGVEAGRRRFSNAPEYVDERINKIVEKKMQDIFDIENNYAKTRKAMEYSKDANATARRRVAETDVLVGSVDDTGTIRTKQPGGAVDKYSAMTIDGKEGVVRDLLEREGLSITPQELQKKLISVIDNDRMLQGKARTKALNDVVDEVAAYTRNADGNIPLSSVHDAKIATTKVIKDFATPVEYKTYQKALARGLKEAIENNSTEDIRIINNELAEYYKDIRLLESLDGKKVKGGKLGKYFSQISGNIIGGIAGNAVGGPVGSAVGTIVGGEVGGRIRSNTFTKTFGKAKGGTARQSDILTKATVKSKSPKLPLGLPEGRGPAENLSPIRLPAPKKTVIEPRAKIVGYSNNDGNLNQRYNSTATASKTGISKVSRETPKKSITKQVVKTEPKIVKSKTLPTKNVEVITSVGDKKFTIKSPEIIYNKGTRIVGEYNGKEYITNSLILEFKNDTGLTHDFAKTPKGPDSDAIQTLINKSKTGSKDIGKPVSMGDSGGGDKVFIFKDGTAVNPDYYNYIAKKYPKLKFEHNGMNGAIIVSSDDKMVGLLMPYNKIVENKNIVPIENVVKPTKRIISEESYKKALKNLGDTSTLNSTPIHLGKDALIVAGYHIENGVRSAVELGERLAKEGYKFTKEQLEELFNKAQNSLKSNDLSTSIQKAKASGQSFDEWVKGQGEVAYRGEGGTNVAQGKALLAEGKHFASDAEYPKGFGKVEEYVLKPNAKVLDLGDSTFAEISQKLGIPERRYISPKELSTIAKEKGYDVVKYAGEYKSTGKQFSHTVDLTGNSFKTRAQLKAEWDKVVKPTKRIISEESYRKALKNLGDTSTLNSTPIHLNKDALIVAGYHIENGVRSAAELGIELAKKGYKFTKEQLEELFNRVNKNVNSEPLLQESKKYKSAEEFVKNALKNDETIKVYRASKTGKVHENIKDFTFFSDDKDYVKQYQKKGEKIVEYNLPKSSLMRDSVNTQELRYLIDSRNPKISQLEDIWNKANKSPLPKATSTLEQEAKKYNSPEEFYNAKGLSDDFRSVGIKGRERFTKFWEDSTGKSAEKSYTMSHRPSELGSGHNISEKGGIPEDVYEHPEWYFNMSDKNYQESFNALKKIRNKPEAEVTIYRAAPKNELNNGDWITLSKGYAKQESLTEGTPVHSFKVKAKDIQFAGDDLNEFGYFPKNKSQLTDISNKANKSPLPKATSTLEQEAKKYKSAEDFINGLEYTKSFTTGKYGKSYLSQTEIGSWSIKNIIDKKMNNYSGDVGRKLFEKSKLKNLDSYTIQEFLESNKILGGLNGDMKNGYMVYRVVPEDGNINPGDFVFTNMKSAEDFLKNYGKKRNQIKIVSIIAKPDELILPVPEDVLLKQVQRLRPYNIARVDEFIYAPKSIQGITEQKLEEIWKKANKSPLPKTKEEKRGLPKRK